MGTLDEEMVDSWLDVQLFQQPASSCQSTCNSYCLKVGYPSAKSTSFQAASQKFESGSMETSCCLVWLKSSPFYIWRIRSTYCCCRGSLWYLCRRCQVKGFLPEGLNLQDVSLKLIQDEFGWLPLIVACWLYPSNRPFHWFQEHFAPAQIFLAFLIWEPQSIVGEAPQ